MKYAVNNITLQYEAAGEKKYGKDVVLLSSALDLTKDTNWHPFGYTIKPLFRGASEYVEFKSITSSLLLGLWKKSGLVFPEEFDLTQYHHIANTREKHLAAVDFTKLLLTSQFPMGIARIENRISEICQSPLIARNPYDHQSIFHFRVIRPQSGDNNPLHRDVWLEDYANCVNLYIPICGSNENSSLILLPGSHLWSEARVERTVNGANINGVKFNVPAVTDIKGSFDVDRPSPGENEVLVFSPYLIHGGAVNLNKDTTRISIELRLWKR